MTSAPIEELVRGSPSFYDALDEDEDAD